MNVRNAFDTGLGLTTFVVLVVGTLQARGRDRRIWRAIASVALLWTLGDITLRIGETTSVFGPNRLLGFPDIFYLCAYAMMAYIVRTLARYSEKPEKRIEWARFYPLTLLVGAPLLSATMAIILPHGVAGSMPNESFLTFAGFVNYIYPALDIGIAIGLLIIFFTQIIPFQRIWQELFIIGFSWYTIADLSYRLFKAAGIYNPANLLSQFIMALWITAYGLFIVAAIYMITDVDREGASLVKS